MENQEQSVKSLNIEVAEDNGITIEPMAQPFKAIIKFSYDELREEFDNYWKAHGDILIKQANYKGRKLKGGGFDMNKAQKALENTKGVSNLYKGCLGEIMGKLVEAEVEDRILIINDASLYNFEPDNEEVMGVALYYYWPKVTREVDSINFELIDPAYGMSAEKQFEEHHVPSLIDKHKAFTPSEDTIVTMDHRASLDVISQTDEGPSSSLTFRSKWHELRSLPEGLSGAIVGKNVGDLFEVDWKFGEEEIHSHIKIYGVMDVFKLDADDPVLYQKEKFENKEECFKVFKEDFDKRIADGRKYFAFDDIITQILIGGQLESIPQIWINLHKDSFTKRHIAQFNGDKRAAIQAVGAVDEQDMLTKFQSQVYQETINQMALNWYSDNFNCMSDREAISKDLETRIKWIAPPAPPVQESAE